MLHKVQCLAKHENSAEKTVILRVKHRPVPVFYGWELFPCKLVKNRLGAKTEHHFSFWVLEKWLQHKVSKGATSISNGLNLIQNIVKHLLGVQFFSQILT
ncbi:hypothetical protein CHARACLAT_021014 [Characodon lateralis]|uniref:Uncharacterized protein n=1 Tax=Characodon lateralis TaxID=208331 RepID=A0ABU7EC70_9TELE|nr:hypothetical protein [Characodon lateralis]